MKRMIPFVLALLMFVLSACVSSAKNGSSDEIIVLQDEDTSQPSGTDETVIRPGQNEQSGLSSDASEQASAAQSDSFPVSKKTAACFYVKSNELFFIDSILRTPIRLSEKMMNEDPYNMNSVLTFASNQLICRYYEGERRVALFSDHSGRDLYYRDVSSTDGNNVLIAEDVSPSFYTTLMVPEKSVVYYVSGLHADLHEYNISTGTTAYVDDMIADLSTSKEADIVYHRLDGNHYVKHIKNANEEKKLSPDSAYEPAPRDTLASFDTDEWYTWRSAGDGKDVYYQNGPSEQPVVHVSESIFRKAYLISPSLNKPVFLFSYATDKAFLLIGADAYEISFGSSVYIKNVSLDKQGKRAYLMTADDNHAEAANALYYIDLEKQDYTTPVLLEDHLKPDYRIDSAGRLYCITESNELVSNGTVLDSGEDVRFLTSRGDVFLYTTNNLPGDYTLKYVKALNTVFVADHVHDHIQRNEQVFWLGDYDDAASTGNLYLFDDTGNHLMDTDVVCFIGYQSSIVS